MSFFGENLFRSSRTNACTKEPVPPVESIVDPCSIFALPRVYIENYGFSGGFLNPCNASESFVVPHQSFPMVEAD